MRGVCGEVDEAGIRFLIPLRAAAVFGRLRRSRPIYIREKLTISHMDMASGHRSEIDGKSHARIRTLRQRGRLASAMAADPWLRVRQVSLQELRSAMK